MENWRKMLLCCSFVTATVGAFLIGCGKQGPQQLAEDEPVIEATAQAGASRMSSLPASDSIEITPADADLAQPIRSIFQETTGDVRITTLGGTVIDYPGLAGGVIHPIAAVRIHDTGTDSTYFVGTTIP